VVIVGRDACHYVLQCVESLVLARWQGLTHRVIYVDNDSRDDTVPRLRQECPQVETILNRDNVGFCRAANQAASVANGRYLLFLNDDTVVDPEAIALLVDFLQATADASAVGSRLLNPDGSDQWSGRRFPSPLNGLWGRRSYLGRLFPNARPLADYLYKTEVSRGIPFAADWVSAAAFMITTEAFRRAGGFAEDYYYWHEAIICDRVRKSGGAVYLHPRSLVVHFEGRGSGTRTPRIRRWHIANFHLGAYRCYCEHHALGPLSPRRWFAAVALASRALALLAATWVEGLAGGAATASMAEASGAGPK
jgi:GT2 family glycosyltransferase